MVGLPGARADEQADWLLSLVPKLSPETPAPDPALVLRRQADMWRSIAALQRANHALILEAQALLARLEKPTS